MSTFSDLVLCRWATWNWHFWGSVFPISHDGCYFFSIHR